uniref:Uncharacterized protein n=1 Tax=Candidatus Kentrum sp. SD TaxID=2126332 RepID=A0A451BP60_9GAMM|nr:MAG: hypothetical protein BECKSD772D_GA0070982_108216 [Candidatus Kentron sp. SD]
MLNVEYLPPLDPGEIKALYKALPGYQAMTDDTARLAEKHGQILNLDSDVLADLNQGLADVNRLEPAERVLEKLYLSVYHQRFQATSRCRQAACTTPPAASGILSDLTQDRRGEQIPSRLHEGLQTGPEEGEESAGNGWDANAPIIEGLGHFVLHEPQAQKNT